MDELISCIAGSMEEQSAVTCDVAINVGQASGGVDDANQWVAYAAQAAGEIARALPKCHAWLKSRMAWRAGSNIDNKGEREKEPH